MSDKCPIANMPVADAMALVGVASDLLQQRLVTRPQAVVIMNELRPRLPLAAVAISQRTPRGVTYVDADGYSFAVNHRAKLL